MTLYDIGFPRRAAALLLGLATLWAAPAAAQAEEATARLFDALRRDSVLVADFLGQMPKGGDLHSHLSGAVYAESYLRWAAEDGLCVSRRELRIITGRRRCEPAGPDTVPAAALSDTSALYNQLVDAMSMRNWRPTTPTSGHAQFFDTFRRFGATDRRTGDMLAEAADRAASGHLRYLELMFTADGGTARALGDTAGWTDDFARMRDTLLALGLQRAVAAGRARVTAVEARRDTVLECGTPLARPGCGVEVRWLYQVLRESPPQRVFAQILTGFMLAQADPRVVGLNLVQPEDGAVSMRDYALHMRMIQFMRPLFPGVRVALHAGELSTALMPAERMESHIGQAVRVAGAERIGHGVALRYEQGADSLLAEMAARGVMVEINMTSNDVILGVRGADHPLHRYMEHGVPVALSTDDEGVARSNMTMEYVKAAREQRLGYPALKMMTRASLQHAFVQGAPLWRDLRTLAPADECAGAAGGLYGARCQAFIAANPRARLQWEMERDLAVFEARMASVPVATVTR